MSLAFSCLGENLSEDIWEATLMRSISFTGDNVKPILRSVSFNGRESEPAILKSFGSGKLIIQGSLSFRKEDTGPLQLEKKISIQSPTSLKDGLLTPSFVASRFSSSRKRALESPIVNQHCPKHRAAVKLQKVYKSFRTRRQLADCAVLVEQRWWRLLDFALLKHNSVSFFHVDEPESVYSRWSRAGRRAATVGRGLSKDNKAQKLALQHWLEAIDPRHRYGHNLHFYYDHWLRCDSKEPFFYWLDVGEGKEVNIENKCPRSKLQQQCIKYLGPKERERYEVIVEDGKLVYKQSMELLDTSKGHKGSKWIFVLSTSKSLYVGQKKKGKFQHSSFLAGGATSAAGRLVVDNGTLKAVWPHSGHYRPTKENFEEFISFLKENNVDLTDVQLSPTEEDEEISGLKSVRSKLDLSRRNISVEPEGEVETLSVFEPSEGVNYGSSSVELKSEGNRTVNYKKITTDQEESDDETDEGMDVSSMSTRIDSPEEPNAPSHSESAGHDLVEASSTSEADYMLQKKNLFLEEQEGDEEVAVPQELILHRINSKKETKSYQLGKQLSFKWTSGAGPRIGCVRDYPSELQFRALEQVSLSPRSDRPYSSPITFTSPHTPSIQSPRIQEVPLSRKVPLLQKPNMNKLRVDLL